MTCDCFARPQLGHDERDEVVPFDLLNFKKEAIGETIKQRIGDAPLEFVRITHGKGKGWCEDHECWSPVQDAANFVFKLTDAKVAYALNPVYTYETVSESGYEVKKPKYVLDHLGRKIFREVKDTKGRSWLTAMASAYKPGDDIYIAGLVYNTFHVNNSDEPSIVPISSMDFVEAISSGNTRNVSATWFLQPATVPQADSFTGSKEVVNAMKALMHIPTFIMASERSQSDDVLGLFDQIKRKD